MVVNLCLPHFNTTVNCNKLCADGYDVTNLLSADTAVRRRGFKLEYFLRPPVQVTLKFGFQVEVCRVDVELWPWGMDRGLACKRLEISTSSDSLPRQTPRQAQQKNQRKGQPCNEQGHDNREQNNGRHLFNGHQSCLPAHQQSANHESQHADRANRRTQKRPLQSNGEGEPAEPAFKLVGRCELTEDTRVCFSNVHFRPRHPFTSAAPPRAADSRQEELWSRGPLSLGSVGQLCVTLPFGGAASALGLKALAVWGQPARCCPAQEVEGVRRAHEASQRRLQQPPQLASLANQPTPSAGTTHSSPSVPEEFLDPITQEVMRLPMLLPGGVSVDSSTLEECQKRDATWGRPPSDPFTGVPFTAASQPLPNPQLKIRIDHFILRTGVGFREGTLGRQSEVEKPQPSRLLAPKVEGEDQPFYGVPNQAIPDDCIRSKKRIMLPAENRSEENGNNALCSWSKRSKHWCNTISTSDLSGPNKEDVGNTPVAAREPPRSVRPCYMDKQPLHELESQRTDTFSTPSSSSHEQRLSASLDEALLCALQGRPSFTSNSLLKEIPNTSQHMLDSTNEKCSACSCFLSLYTTSTSLAYRLPCAHLLCRACLHSLSRPLNSVAIVTASHVLCPTCQNPASCRDIIRVHH